MSTDLWSDREKAIHMSQNFNPAHAERIEFMSGIAHCPQNNRKIRARIIAAAMR
jgi:hypothetical protein